MLRFNSERVKAQIETQTTCDLPVDDRSILWKSLSMIDRYPNFFLSCALLKIPDNVTSFHRRLQHLDLVCFDRLFSNIRGFRKGRHSTDARELISGLSHHFAAYLNAHMFVGNMQSVVSRNQSGAMAKIALHVLSPLHLPCR